VTTIRPEAAAARREGAAAAHVAAPRSACPHPTGGWLAFNWLVGHALEMGHVDAADLFRAEAGKAWKREVRDRAREVREAIGPPKETAARAVRTCELEGCDVRLTRKQRGYCGREHYKLSGAQERRGSRTAA
jgi:hypothetical protein